MRRIKILLTTIGDSDPRPQTYLARLFHRPRYDAIVGIIRELMGERVNIILDVGCGRGILYKWLLKSGVSPSIFVGCDLNKSLLKSANCERVMCDACNLPFKNLAAECIVCSEVLEHIEKPLLLFINLLKVSKEFIIVTFPDEKVKNLLGFRYPEHISTPDSKELVEAAKRFGFMLLIHKRLYFAFPPSVLDKIMSFSPTKLRFISRFFTILSFLLGRLCLIKTEIFVFKKQK